MTWRIILVGLAVAAFAVPLPPDAVERYYSSAIFPVIQAAATTASNLSAVAWLDGSVVLVACILLVLCARDFLTRPVASALGRIGIRLLTAAAVVYLAFLLMWGLNYRRESLRRKVPFDSARITPDAAVALGREAVAQVNATYVGAHDQGWVAPRDVDQALATSFRDATRSLGFRRAIVPGRPKHSLLDLYFRRAGVAAMTDPLFLETLVASDLLPFERPHVVAHEWAHLAGVTDEGEANFVGWLACVRGTPAHRYSGWLFLYGEVAGALPRDAAREVSSALASGPRADLQAIRQRYQREVSPRISGAGWQVYDRYLKANHVDAGTASYAEVVQLVLGTQLR